MGTLLKTLFISVTLFMLVATSHEPNKIFQDLVTHFADNSKATPAAAWKEFYKSIHGNDPNRPVFRKLIEIWGIEKPSAITVLYSGTRELVKKIHEPVTIFTRLSIVKFYEELREKIEFWNNLDSKYDKKTIIRALEIDISIVLAEQAERDVCYIGTNKYGNAYGGEITVFGKYEVPNLSEDVQSVFAIVLDVKGDGTYDPSKDNSFKELKDDLTQGGIILRVIYITGVETEQLQLKIVERILKAIKFYRQNPWLVKEPWLLNGGKVIKVTGEDYMDIFMLE